MGCHNLLYYGELCLNRGEIKNPNVVVADLYLKLRMSLQRSCIVVMVCHDLWHFLELQSNGASIAVV